MGILVPALPLWEDLPSLWASIISPESKGEIQMISTAYLGPPGEGGTQSLGADSLALRLVLHWVIRLRVRPALTLARCKLAAGQRVTGVWEP